VKLGRILARDARDGSGKPYYMFGVGSSPDSSDPYHEHWGEPAYAVALAWHHSGRSDPFLYTEAMKLIQGMQSHGSAPHLRSFGWQCRGAVAAPRLLTP